MRQDLLCAAFRGHLVISMRRSQPDMSRLMEHVPAAYWVQPQPPARPPGPATAAAASALDDAAQGVRTLARHA